MINPPTNVKSNAQDKHCKDMLEVIKSNSQSHSNHTREITDLKNLKKLTWEVADPKGVRRLESGLPHQVVDKVRQGMVQPSVTYSYDGVDPLVCDVVRDGIKTIQEDGGYFSVLVDKPNIFNESLSYGDSLIRIGWDEETSLITFDNVPIDSIYIDSNATVMHSANSVRSVTRMVVIYAYDYDQATSLYPNVNFGLGKIPRDSDTIKDFLETTAQDWENKKQEVEFAHYFNIGGDKPVYAIYAGESLTKVATYEGADYPFIKKKTGKPFIPVNQFRCFDSEEGFWNKGLLHPFYKYAIVRRELLNKAINQSLNAMSDTKVLNTAKGKGGVMLKRIKDSRSMVAAGQNAVIINDTGEAVTVSQVEANNFENAQQAYREELDREIKRWGINLDGIGQAPSTSATQILQEAGVQDELKLDIINRNTEFFRQNDVQTMELVRSFIDENDERPIRTSVRIPKVKLDKLTGEMSAVELPNGEIATEELTGITYGDIRQLLDKYDFFVEVNTKSGIRESDHIKTARAQLLMQSSGGNPALIGKALKMLASANNISLTEEELGKAPVQTAGLPAGLPAGPVDKAIPNLV